MSVLYTQGVDVVSEKLLYQCEGLVLKPGSAKEARAAEYNAAAAAAAAYEAAGAMPIASEASTFTNESFVGQQQMADNGVAVVTGGSHHHHHHHRRMLQSGTTMEWLSSWLVSRQR